MSHAQLRVWPALAGVTISPEIYGHQMEMVGRSVYDGIWAGRSSGSANEDGLRLDVLALFKHLRVPLLKWPGDAFADYYHWNDGVGTGGKRPHRVNVPWQQIEPNTFGTHEFAGLCEKLECRPWVNGNGHTGSLDELLSWLEYSTFGGDTARTAERCHNGSPEPFDLPLWGMSRCTDWELTGFSALNPDVELFVPLGEAWECAPVYPVKGTNTEDRGIAGLSISHYFRLGSGAAFGKEGYYHTWHALQVFERKLKRLMADLYRHYGEQSPAIALGSWGVWHDEADAENGLEQPNTLRDALLAASVYHVLNQQAGHVARAAMAQAVNALQCLAKTEGPAMFLTPTYHVLDMMRGHRGARLVTHRLESPQILLDKMAPAKRGRIPSLQVSTSRQGKRLCITVVNRSYTESIPLQVEIREGDITSLSGRLLHADSASAENSFESPKRVSPERIELTADGNTFHDTLPPHAFAAYSVMLGKG